VSVSADPSASTSSLISGPVTLVVPAVAAMVRVGRLTASSVASIADLSIDDIDDIKIAVSEMITLLIQSDNRSSITLRFEVDAQSFTVEASTPSSALDLGRNDVALATAVLDAVSDRHEVAHVDDRILMKMVKTISPRPES